MFPFCKRSVSVSEEEAEYLIDDSTTGSYPIEGQPFPVYGLQSSCFEIAGI